MAVFVSRPAHLQTAKAYGAGRLLRKCTSRTAYRSQLIPTSQGYSNRRGKNRTYCLELMRLAGLPLPYSPIHALTWI